MRRCLESLCWSTLEKQWVLLFVRTLKSGNNGGQLRAQSCSERRTKIRYSPEEVAINGVRLWKTRASALALWSEALSSRGRARRKLLADISTSGTAF